MNKYKLYFISEVKKIMMFKYVAEFQCDNIIEAEDYFENSKDSGYNSLIPLGQEYIITTTKIN